MKRKLTMDDYFLSKEQLKRYKSGNLNYNETVYLSNNNVTDEILYIDTSKFKGCKIIIFNSSIETLYISASVKIPLVTVCPVSFLLRIHSISPRRISSSWRSPLPQFLWFPDGDLCVSRHIVGAAHQMG